MSCWSRVLSTTCLPRGCGPFSKLSNPGYKVRIGMPPRRSSRLSALNSGLLKGQEETSDHAKPVKGSRKRKGEELKEADEPPSPGRVKKSPSTPKRKVAKTTIPPNTPTPAGLSDMAKASRPLEIRDKTPEPPINRLADPLGTNAALISPGSSRLLTNKAVADASPSKLSNLRFTTSNILEQALDHLIKAEPKLKPVIEKHPCHMFSPEGLAEVIDPFVSLTSSIIGQQVSGAAAKSIKAKFVALFNPSVADAAAHTFPTPSKVAATDLATLRSAGLSQRKAEYIQGLAEKFANGELSTEVLMKADYGELFEKLIAVRGLGKWSVEMFACFGLKRLDVFSTGDLGVQRGMAVLVGKDISKLKAKGGGKWKYMSEQDMLDISDKFAPYRSVFMWYTWRIEDVDITTFEN